MPKILYVITKSNFGGAQRYVYELATAFSHEAEIVVVLGGEGTLKKKLEENGIRTISIPFLNRNVRLFNDIRVYKTLLKTIRAERPDILHLNSSKIGGLGALVGRQCDVPRIIFTAHGWEFNNPARSAPARLAIALLSWVIVLLAHKTIAVSEAMKAQMRRFPFAARKIRVIRNGVNEILFVPKNDARAVLAKQAGALEMPADAIWIGTLAELHPVKGLSEAVDAVGKLLPHMPNIHYFICGEGEYWQKLETQIAQAGIGKHVHLVGYLPEAPKYLSAFDVFMLPSRAEALSYALLEAGAAGLPAIATRAGGIPEIITNEKNGLLVPQNDAEALAAAIRTLAQDREKRDAFGAALKEKVTRQFSFERMVSETRNLYGLT